MSDLHFSVETNPHQDYKHKVDLLWKKHHKAKQKVLWFGLAVSVVLFVVGYRENTESVKTVAGFTTYYTYWNLGASLGASVFICCAFLAVSMRQGKLNFVIDANLSAKWLPEEGKLKITEDRIWQESSVYNYDMDWKMIMSYSIDDRYLFLNTRRQPDYGIAINKEKLDEREYASLLKFLHKSGLREK